MNATRTASGTVGVIAAFLALAGGGPVLAQCEIGTLTAGDVGANDKFGFAVAISGDYAVVGAPHPYGMGAAYVFKRDGLNWVEVTTLEPPNVTIELDDEYGRAVALDGNVAVVGAREHTVTRPPPAPPIDVSQAGAAYVFRRNAGGTWVYEGELTALIPEENDQFGYGVAVAGDRIAVGASNEDGPSPTVSDSGTVYAFKYDGVGSWEFEKTLRALDPGASDNLGRAVSMHGDRLLVGAERDDLGVGATDAGSAYVFRRDAVLGWVQEGKLTAQSDSGGADFHAGDKFGRTVSIDGDRLVIGASFHDGVGSNSGAAYVYAWDAAAQEWVIEKKLTAVTPTSRFEFGRSVAIDGDLILVGARDTVADEARAGAAHLFRKRVVTWEWVTTFDNSDPQEVDLFGDAANACALDGNYAVVGAFNDDGNGTNSGAAYVFWVTLVEYCLPDGIADVCQINDGTLADDNANGIPDQCECQPADPCHEVPDLSCTTDFCDPDTLRCTNDVNPGFCAILGECRTNGEERPGNECQECDPALDPRAWSPKVEGTACTDDGLFCNGGEICVNGICTGMGDPCPALGLFCDESTAACVECVSDANCDDGNDCTAHVCERGVCIFSDVPPGTPCGDPRETDCDLPDFCNDLGVCLPNYELAGTPCGDPTETDCDLADVCSGSGVCLANLRPDGTTCPDDGSECTDDICIRGSCEHPDLPPGTWCGDPSDIPCTAPDTCDGSGYCLNNHVSDGASCSNGEFCDGEELCLDGACESGDPPCDWAQLECDETNDECRCDGDECAVLYVDDLAPGPNHDGLTWEAAYTHLQDALAHATASLGAVTEIRVAQGTYTPDQGRYETPGDRRATFQLIDGVAIEGGYAGWGAGDPDQRDIAAYETVLSGDLNDDDDPEPIVKLWEDPTRDDNSYHVATSDGNDETSVLDGFTVTAGNANGDSPHDRGGGIRNGIGSPTLSNCLFDRNSASWGGGAMQNSTESHPTLIDCTFQRNEAFTGGGIYSYGSAPVLMNCHFVENAAPWLDRSGYGGGGVASYASSPTFIGCTFRANSGPWGGAVYSWKGEATVLRDCTFIGNSAGKGGGVFESRTSAQFVDCVFVENSALGSGGGISSDRGHDQTFTRCTFLRNSASYGGGIDCRDWPGPTLTACLFQDNTATDGGGGLWLDGGTAVIAHTSFRGNAAELGGAIFLDLADARLNSCILNGNSARQGGAIWAYYTDLQLINCMLSFNRASECGGGMFSLHSAPMLDGCTLSGNTANRGTALAFDSYQYNRPSNLAIVNSVLWNGGDEIWNNDGSTISITYSDVEGGWPGVGNIHADPLFVDPIGPDGVPGTEDDNLRLSAGSPCIDAGDNDAVPPDLPDLDDDGDTEEPIPFDLDGFARFFDDPDTPDTGEPGELGPPVVDMGAYEFRPTVIAALDIMPQRCPNRLPRKAQGMIRIALLGTEAFDVSSVELDSLLLKRADGLGGSIAPVRTPPGLAPKVRDVATPFEGELCDCHHHGQDGVHDLLLVFPGGKLARALQLESVPGDTDVVLTLSGLLNNATSFEGSDCVRIHPGSPHSKPPSPRRGATSR